MIFNQLAEFKRDIKKLSKKYKSLIDDFEDFCLALEQSPRWEVFWDKSIVRISNLWKKLEWKEFYKVRRFRCFSISRNSKDSWIRIIYNYNEKNTEIEFEKIEFIEIFHKNTKENHDINRIESNYSQN